MISLKNKDGQSSAVEYVVTFFLVGAAISAMSLYVRRVLQAKVRDAVYYMADTVEADYNGSFRFQYEPYYTMANSEKVVDSTDTLQQSGSLPLSSGISQKDYDYVTTMSTNAVQLRPEFAD